MGTSTVALDSSAPLPLYHQLKEILREKIVSGEWTRGWQIPSETQLCSIYAISRITVRQAIDDLVTGGWLYRQRGRGTFVRSSKPEVGLSPLLMLEQLSAFPGPPEHIALRTRVVVPPAMVRHSLQLEPRERVLEIVRVRIIYGKPSALEIGYIPRRILHRYPNPEEISLQYFYEILRRCTGTAPERTRVVIEAVLVGPEEAKVLKARRGSPALRLERLTTSLSGEPVLLTHNIITGDHSKYVLELDVPLIERMEADRHVAKASAP